MKLLSIYKILLPSTSDISLSAVLTKESKSQETGLSQDLNGSMLMQRKERNGTMSKQTVTPGMNHLKEIMEDYLQQKE